jgi:O-Antigen ligase
MGGNLHFNELNYYKALLFTYFMLSPFYLFGSGVPQLGDLVLLITILSILLSGRFIIYNTYKFFLFTAICFVVHIVAVNAFWAFWLSDDSIVYNSLFYMFNVSGMLAFLFLFKKIGPSFFRILYFAASTSTILQFILSLFFTSGQYRESLFYNNPNQLGYASLTYLSIILVTSQAVKKGSWLLYLAIPASLLLVAASLSKSAVISAGGMLIVWLIFTRKWSVKMTTLFIGMSVLFVFSNAPELFAWISNAELVTKLESRISDIGSANDDNLAMRGYDRIANHPHYLIFGAGEGAYDRFDSVLSGYEIHSTLGNLFFSYGAIGLILFLLIIVQSIFKRHLSSSSPLFFVLLYGVAHNGMRDTMFWVLISLVYLSWFCYQEARREGGQDTNSH